MGYKLLVYVAVFAVLLSGLACAECPCSRPGKPGRVVRYTCENGTATGVSLYLDKEVYGVGDTVTVTAGKDVGGDIVPAEALAISLYKASEAVDGYMTNPEGGADFGVLSPGEYELRGGDATLIFSVKGTISVNETTGGNETNQQDEITQQVEITQHNKATPTNVKTNGFIELIRKLFQLFEDAAFGKGV
jgi:hypothetical protein